jgi:hypothetical protein
MASLKNAMITLYQKIFGTVSTAEPVDKNAIGMERAVSIQDVWMQSYSVDQEMWPVDLYLENGSLVLLGNKGGKLYKSRVMDDDTGITFGVPEEIKIEFVPVGSGQEQQSLNRMLITRNAEGKYRFFCRACSSVINKAGVIDSTKMFDRFVERFEGGTKFQILFFHDPNLVMGDGDFVARDGNILITSGILNDSVLSQAFVDAYEQKRGDWGNSIGFMPMSEPTNLELTDGIKIPMYEDGELREVSVLPESDACSYFTRAGVLNGENPMDTRVKDALHKLFGEERAADADAFIEDVDNTNRSIQEQGLLARSTSEGNEDEANTSETTEEPKDESETEVPASDNDKYVELDTRLQKIEASLAQLTESMNAPKEEPNVEEAIEKALSPIRAEVEKLQVSEDEKRQQWLDDLPNRANASAVTHRPREERRPQPSDQPPSYEDLAKESLAKLKH